MSKLKAWRWIIGCWLVAGGGWNATTSALMTNTTGSTSAGGGWSGSTAYSSYGLLGEGTIATPLSGPQWISFSGFANAFVMHPDSDLNGNGIPDENDPDNEGDGLSDEQELAGALFDPPTSTDPNLADSDLDGMSDAQEASAGTDPRDASRYFALLPLSRTGQGMVVPWQARAGRTYEVLFGASVTGLPGATVADVTPGGGEGPWQETIGVFTGAVSGAGFWAVRLKE
ncbi:MAG: hypothetical protein V2A34_00565 [Lentisphaerota bacterium]